MNSSDFNSLISRSPDISAGQGRSASLQCGLQAAALIITLAVSITSGLLTGELCKISHWYSN